MDTLALDRAFDEILRQRRLRTLLQPIIRLESGETVGYEGLVRGPPGSPLESASALLTEAYRTDRVVEFDWAARASACRLALGGGVRSDALLFLNIEPLAMESECPPDLWPDIEQAFGRFKVVLEITERSLGRDPSSLLSGIDGLRSMVSGLALDDVGSRTMTLAMLPVLSVDVIKLDRSITQGGTSLPAMKVLDLVHEEAERTGAAILAEGIETAPHVKHAMATGAELGQGYYFGQPAPLPPRDDGNDGFVDIGAESAPDVTTPFDAVADRRTNRATADLLVPLGRQVVFGETDLSEPALFVLMLPDAAWFGPAERETLAHLVERGVVTGVLGRGAPREAVPGVRGARDDDPALEGQWAVLALSPRSAGAILARSIPGTGEYEFVITHNRRRVVAAARRLVRRLGPPA